MRTIEEIKADIEECSCFGTQSKLDALWLEWFRCLFYSIEPDRLSEICQAEREQRAVVLPCKVGGIVYNRKGEKYFVTGISIADDIVISAAKDRANSIWTGIQFEPFDIGVTVFLTYEAAQAALDGGAK